MADEEKFNEEEYDEATKESANVASGEDEDDSSRALDPLKKKPNRSPETKAATFRIGETLIERIDEATTKYAVEKGSFVKALLIYALDQLDDEAWQLPPTKKKKA